MTIFYIDQNGNYYIDQNGKYYIEKEISNFLDYKTYIYKKSYQKYTPCIYKASSYKRVKVCIYNGD